MYSILCDDQFVNFFYKLNKWFFKFLEFLLETLCSSQFCELELNLNLIALHLGMHHDIYFVHTSYRFLFYFIFCPNLQSILGFCFFFALCLCPYPSTMPRKTRANRTPSLSSVSLFRSELFRNDRCRQVFKKLNCKRKIWAERSVVLDDVDPAIRANFESRG